MKEKNKAKIGILSLGCPRNLVDSESILARINRKGYPIVGMDEAEVAIINTCAFVEDARLESVDAILDLVALKKKGQLKKIIVYGCLSQRYKQKLQKELPEIDAFVGKISLNHGLKRFSLTPRHYAYLKICEGCINKCNYCIIPKISSRFTSLKVHSLLKKVEQFQQEGVCELNIIGQDITGYGIDLYGKIKLPELLSKTIKKAKKINWIRLLYLYPSRLTDELIELIKDEPKICKYIDLPLQHINGRILRLMNRQMQKKEIFRLIDKIRKKIPAVAIRTSFIVGFPSEQDDEFQELLRFIKDIRFERLGAFIYSQEEGTPAYDFKKQIPHKIKVERFNALMLEQQSISREINKKFLNQNLEVLIDEQEHSSSAAQGSSSTRKGGVYLGRSQYDAPEVDGLVYVNSKKQLQPGDFVTVKITDTLEYDLAGEALK